MRKQSLNLIPGLQAAGVTPGSGGAADLLGALGIWGPHDNIGLRQLGMTPEFPAQLQAGPATFWPPSQTSIQQGTPSHATSHPIPARPLCAVLSQARRC